MAVLPVCLFEPRWVQFSALLPERPRCAPTHPLGCHRRRIDDRVVVEPVLAALVHGSGYERIASVGCSDATIRRRLKEWAAAGLSEQVHTLALEAYDRLLGLDLDDLAVDGCITKAPGGGEVAGRSPVDRGEGGLKRSVVTAGTGLPLHLVAAGANRHDAPLLAPTLAGPDQLDDLPDDVTVHRDRGSDSRPTRALLDTLGCDGASARKGIPAPVPAGSRWVVERTHSWMNGYGKLRRCTETRRPVVDCSLPRPRRRPRRAPPTHPARSSPLALALTSHLAPSQVGSLLSVALTRAVPLGGSARWRTRTWLIPISVDG